jgi:hypothetical protein
MSLISYVKTITNKRLLISESHAIQIDVHIAGKNSISTTHMLPEG